MIYNSASPETKFQVSPFCSQGGKLETCVWDCFSLFHKVLFRLYFDTQFFRGKEDYLVARTLEAVKQWVSAEGNSNTSENTTAAIHFKTRFWKDSGFFIEDLERENEGAEKVILGISRDLKQLALHHN